MTVRELIESDTDIDVIDDYDERCWIAKCGAYRLTEEAEREFHQALELEVEIKTNGFGGLPIAIIACDSDDDDLAERNVKICKHLFFSLAGYCPEDEFDRWFEFVD